MKRSLFAIGLALFLFACGNRGDNPYDDHRTVDNTTAVTDTNTNDINNNGVKWSDTETRDFVSSSVSAGMMEVELGRLAQEKASSAAVKKFGEMMVKDHSKANKELQVIADSVHMNVPQIMQDAHQQNIDQLKSLTGAEFDKAYVEMMVEEHRKDVEKLEEAQDRILDQPLANWARNTLPVLRGHYDRIQQIQQTAQQ